MVGGGRSCTVVGCLSRSSTQKNKHFYHFPSEQTLQDVWKIFTRRGNDYGVKKSSYICEDHFDPSCFVFKKKQICLAKNTIPTIFYRTTPEGETERILLTFDRDVMHYIEEDTLLNPIFDKEKREEELIEKRDQKIKEIEKLCRFCLEDRGDEDLIEINKLLKYSINPSEVMPHILISNIEIFNKKACEECFQQIIVFDGYRKRCRRSQDLIIEELKRVESEIVKLNGADYDTNSWLKTETIAWADDDEGCDDESPVENVQTGPQFHQIIMKQEEKEEIITDDHFIGFDYQTPLSIENPVDENCLDGDQIHDTLFSNPKKVRKAKRKFKSKAEKLKDLKTQNTSLAVSPTEISTRYEEDTINLKDVHYQSTVIQKCNFYECFFCKLVRNLLWTIILLIYFYLFLEIWW